MSLLDRLRKKALPRLADERGGFKAALPGADGEPWLEMDCGWETRATPEGESTRLRAHLHADFSRLFDAIADRTPAPQANHRLLEAPRPSGGLADRSRALAEQSLKLGLNWSGRLITRGLRTDLARQALAPLRHRRLDTWLDLRSTTQPLDAPGTLLPARLAELGVRPQADGPPLQSWATPTLRGAAAVTTLQLDERHLPQRGDQRPTRIAATIAHLIEDHPESSR